jgi:hypothetical protein
MPEDPRSVAHVERAMRSLARAHGLPEPDEVIPGEDGAVLCLWHASKVAVVVEPDDGDAGEPP